MRRSEHEEPTLASAIEALVAEGEQGAAVLVEGEKDEEALRVLGFEGPILRLHRGDALINLFHDVARRRRRVILLVDWDRKGGHLARLSREAARANGVTLDESHRRALSRAARGEARHVEALPRLLDTLARRAGVKGR